jgi:hypothetical protein
VLHDSDLGWLASLHAYQNIRWLQIAMHNALRVQIFHCFHNGLCNVQALLLRENLPRQRLFEIALTAIVHDQQPARYVVVFDRVAPD